MENRLQIGSTICTYKNVEKIIGNVTAIQTDGVYEVYWYYIIVCYF